MTPTWWSAVVVGLALLSHQPSLTPTVAACARCAWQPPSGRLVDVDSVAALERAVSAARSGDTLLLADGDYALERMLDVAVAKVTIRSRSGNPAGVVIHGRGMENDPVGVAISVSAPDVVIADVTIHGVRYHAVQIRGEQAASRAIVHNVVLRDTGQQLLKGSVAENGRRAENGLVACSAFSYTTSAPSNYTNGVDILGTAGWVVRDNRFLRIRGPERAGWSAGPTILAWQGAEDTVVERNVIIDSFRGVALGLQQDSTINGPRGYDHLRGVIRDNTVVNLHGWADEAIEANGARDVRIERNTVVVEGKVPWSIGVRFPTARAVVVGNVTTRQVLERDGGRASVEGHTLLKGAGQP